MPRKKESKVPQYVKFAVLGLIVIAAGYFAVTQTAAMLTKVDYFKVRSVTIDPSLQFVNKRDLKGLMGKNIFTIDLKSVQRKLNSKYPQASQLKVIKKFPNQISVLAKQRLPFAQMIVQNRNVVLDKDGIILGLPAEKDKKLPVIEGAKVISPNLVLGLPLRGSDLWLSLKILKLFESNDGLEAYKVTDLNVENMSKIIFSVSDKLDVIIDRDDIAQKIRVLSVVLAQDTLNLKEVKYVDLRFKEPIIGKK